MRYLYFKLYQLFRKVKTNITPATNAMILMSVFQTINLLTLLYLLEHYYDINFSFKINSELDIFPVFVCIPLYGINYLFLYKYREEIWQRYINESQIKNIFGIIVLCLYFIISFILVYLASSIE